MGDVVPFIARVRSSGDWTAAERARLEELAYRLSSEGGARVETVFGATDAGDPWCVVTDENGDVLIHVARINGKFVVHSAVDDALSEGADLHAALRERLHVHMDDDEGVGVIVPFSLGGRHAQTFLALVIASAFFYETAVFTDTAEAAPLGPTQPPPDEPPPPAPEINAPTQEREVVIQGVALSEPPTPNAPVLVAAAAVDSELTPPVAAEAAPLAAEPPPLPEAPAEAQHAAVEAAGDSQPVQVITGTAGNDRLTGTAADERLLGGEGNDTLQGGGGNDTLEGGAGDDQIELGAQVTAAGGEGADTFVIVAPKVLGNAETLLGVVTDFDQRQGDRLVIWRSASDERGAPPAAERSPAPAGREGDGSAGGGGGGGGGATWSVDDPLPNPGAGEFGFEPGFTTVSGPQAGNGTTVRVDIDVDGDGVLDGYVLLSGAATEMGEPIMIGHALGWDDPFA